MKITSVHIHAITLPLVRPFIVAYASYNEMPSIIVKVETDQGLVGYGESVPDQHVTGRHGKARTPCSFTAWLRRSSEKIRLLWNAFTICSINACTKRQQRKQRLTWRAMT